MFHLKTKGCLDEKKFGFTPQKSTIDAIFSAIDFIRQTFEMRGYAMLIALDITGAFNNCWWPMILDTLREMECPRNLFLLTKSYFSCRIAKLWFQNIEVSKSITKGCSQGSTSGPGFWNIVFNSCLKLGFEKDTYGQGFADDLLLKSFAKSTDELEGKVNKALELLSQWAENNKLEFNASKTTAVLFTKNLKFIEPKIKLYNQELKLSTVPYRPVTEFQFINKVINSPCPDLSHKCL